MSEMIRMRLLYDDGDSTQDVYNRLAERAKSRKVPLSIFVFFVSGIRGLEDTPYRLEIKGDDGWWIATPDQALSLIEAAGGGNEGTI